MIELANIMTEDTGRVIFLAVAADDNYSLPLAVTLSSVLSRIAADSIVDLTIVDGGMSPGSRKRLKRVAAKARRETSIRWIETPVGDFEEVRVTSWGNESNYLRLLLPDLLEQETERVLYLDSDVLARDDVAKLWALADGRPDVPVWAATSFGHPTIADAYGSETSKSLELDPAQPFFNTGVMLISFPAWRKRNITEKAVEAARTQQSIMRYSDQDAINIALDGSGRRIDDRWNLSLASLTKRAGSRQARHDAKARIRRAGIIHYTGPNKPWQPGYAGLEGRRFRSALYQSGWFDSFSEALRWAIRYWFDPAWITAMKTIVARHLPRMYRAWRRVRASTPS